MFKNYLTLGKYEGGLNDRDDPRDILDNQFSDIENMVVHDVGRIRTIGSFDAHGDSNITPNAAGISAGFGLFKFSADYDVGAATNAVITNSGGYVSVAATSHGRSVGDRIMFSGVITDYGGIHTITTITDANNFITDYTYVSDDNECGYLVLTGVNNTMTDYLLMCDSDSASIDVYPTTRDLWLHNAIPLGGTSGVKAVFHQIDGAVRIADANFGATNKVKWVGYVLRNRFGGTQSFDDWRIENNTLDSPTRGLFGLNVVDATDLGGLGDTNSLITNETHVFDGMGTEIANANAAGEYYYATYRWDVLSTQGQDARVTGYQDTNEIDTSTLVGGDSWADIKPYGIFPYPGKGFNVDVTVTAGGGTWEAGDYELSQTFVYDNNQESLPVKLTGDGDLLAITNNAHLTLLILATTSNSHTFNSRITGGRIYIREYKEYGNETWTLLCDIDLNNGVRGGLNGNYTAWLNEVPSTAHADGITYHKAYIVINDMNIDTYETINGFSQDEVAIDIGDVGMGYKASCVAGRRVFIFAPKTTDKDGQTRYIGDRIMYSLPNKPDTFITSNYIDVGVNDGDEFVAGVGFADRILAFKRNKLYIINISQASSTAWFLESEHAFMGVPNSACVFSTEFGVTWSNAFGCYFYNGKQISELTQNLNNDNWQSFFSDNSMMGYIPKHKQVMVVKSCSNDADGGDGYLYDFRTKAWINVKSKFIDSQIKTNMIIDWNNDLVMAHTDNTGSIVIWDNTKANDGEQEFTTKDIDFGFPSLTKKIYNVYITYKSNDSLVNPFYFSINGSSSFFNVTKTFATASNWDVAVCPINYNCQSIKLKFNPAETKQIEINDITIEYRIKSFKQVS